MSSSLNVDARLKGRTANGCLIKLVRASKAGQLAKQGNFLDTSSQSKTWGKNLSPFIAGPVDLYDGMSFFPISCIFIPETVIFLFFSWLTRFSPLLGHVSQCVENAWQYCKVYGHMCDEKGDPTAEYWEWAKEGWANPKAKRFPLGKGSKPEFSYWNGKKLGYMDARLHIYCKLYANAVKNSPFFEKLKKMTETNTEIILSDPDAQDYIADERTLKEALFDTSKPLSHSLVLAMLLCDVPVWEEFIEASNQEAAASSSSTAATN
jgi:hypothetical protein